MCKIREYIVLYLMLDRLGRKEDLLSLGVQQSSIESEDIRRKAIADAITEMFFRYDADLRKNTGYAQGVGTVGIQGQHFGPATLMFVPHLNKESVKAMYALAAIGLPRVLRKMGTMGRFVRGALVKGFGWEIAEGRCRTLYGPVMAKAWNVLTERAYSPRIIIEEEIYKIVSDRSSYGPGRDGDWLPLYVKRDYDGQGIFDYLAYDEDSPSIRHDGRDVVVREMREMLHCIVQISSNWASHCSEHDSSASVRMLLALSDYVKDSLGAWTNESGACIIEHALAEGCEKGDARHRSFVADSDSSPMI